MNAREIALKIVKEKKDKEEEARRIEAAERQYVRDIGRQYYDELTFIVNQFKEDFDIKQLGDSYAWQFTQRLPLHAARMPSKFYVVLSYESHTFQPSDESDEITTSEWEISVQVPNQSGRYNPLLRLSAREDWSCKADNGALETEFGKYMAKWY